MEIREIFENLIKIEPKVISIDSLFNNPERVQQTNYKPFYQRNYVWDDEKATYFIESILLGTEIPPLIYFRNGDTVEVIDGRQRYQTILRFTKNEFKLKKNGLHKLQDIGIANKLFKDIDEHLQDLFYDTKLRVIEFSFHSKPPIDEEIEERVKKEIFKRYNSGITPLKPTEIDKAAYFEDDLNTYIKNKIQGDSILYRDISSLLHFEKSNTEIILKKIRQLLVQHQIPIKYYGIKKDTVISKYYDSLFSNIDANEVPQLFHDFIEKINLIKKIKVVFNKRNTPYNRLITECLFWAFSILNNEGYYLQEITENIINDLVTFIGRNIDSFGMDRSSFSKVLFSRYELTSEFFSDKFAINFDIYLYYNSEFKQRNQEITPQNKERTSFDELRINKPEPSSSAIMDICRQMVRQRFLIRPPYQRNEVINKKKSSSIIESILLGIKLPPLFVFKRSDGISEVLDGQQRLLSILGFIQEQYMDENYVLKSSNKDGYSLNLKNSILKNLNGKTFVQLSPEEKSKIKNFDLWIIEINQSNNKNFEPIDLFIRLNNKPYPIKEDTFEMWNSYISRDIIETIKSIHKNNKDWFYLRKNNSRMEDENIYTALAYFQFSLNGIKKGYSYESDELDIYKVVDKINLRIRSKNEITKVLEDADHKEAFIQACNDLEFGFIKKVRELLTDDDDRSVLMLNKNLDNIFRIENGRRTQQSFYALWHFIFDIPLEAIKNNKIAIRAALVNLFNCMTGIETKGEFEKAVKTFKVNFNTADTKNRIEQQINFAKLNEITLSGQGVLYTNTIKPSNSNVKDVYPYYRKTRFEKFQLLGDEIINVSFDDKISRDIFDPRERILVRRFNLKPDRLILAYVEKRLAFGNDIFCFIPNRKGFNTKFIATILNSRYVYHQHVKTHGSKLDAMASSSLSDLKEIQIPTISYDAQVPFIRIFEFMMVQHSRPEINLFFERLLDAMVYEVYIYSEIARAGSEVLKFLEDLPQLEMNREADLHIVETVYENLSNSKHSVGTSLLNLLNVEIVEEIESTI